MDADALRVDEEPSGPSCPNRFLKLSSRLDSLTH